MLELNALAAQLLSQEKVAAHSMKLKRTKEPFAQIAYAICPPEPLRRLTWC